MLEPGGRPDLAEEASQDLRAIAQVVGDDLEDLEPPHERVPGQVDDAHPAATEASHDLEIGYHRALVGRRCRPRLDLYADQVRGQA